VLVRSNGSGDGMWSAEMNRGDLALMRVALGSSRMAGTVRRPARTNACRSLEVCECRAGTSAVPLVWRGRRWYALAGALSLPSENDPSATRINCEMPRFHLRRPHAVAAAIGAHQHVQVSIVAFEKRELVDRACPRP